ncbi:hypothetical protein BDW59DRAFT_151169 [Aspergillus cavernicola]|uniref:F-box domain-containing protein n=1 Tax=Aspergillus cavernicola TaxID=176166 RepID=A0ABR4HWT2_9EURO
MARSFADFPVEIIQIIASYLPNSGIKTLRLTCHTLCNTVCLRLDRAFLSANPLNIAVFRAIADSETFRHGIKEIIWDDARFIKAPLGEFHIADEREDLWIDEETGCPEWFVDACKENREGLEMRKYPHSDQGHVEQLALVEEQAAAELPLKISWQYYQNLLQQQEDMIIFNMDAEALEYGVRRFPALKRVTVTPAAHGWIFTPLYKTPMIRAFPKGFNYPIPRGWPDIPEGTYKPEATPWEDEATQKDYRGFGIVMRALASYIDHHVSELIITANTLQTGLNCRVLETPNTQYTDFATILRKPGFTRLDLSLLVRGQERTGWPVYRNGYLRRALDGAHSLEHISLSTNVDEDPASDSTIPGSAGGRDQLVPLRAIFPVNTWKSLRHFSLSGFLVDKDDIISFLSALPPTLRSVHLGFLYFVDHGGSYRELLIDMRDKLDWRTRDPADRPVVSLAKPTFYKQIGHAVWLDNEVREFLYGEGENPFYGGGIAVDDNGVIRDAFLPGVEWKNEGN